MASPDQFTVEGPIAANALQAATVSTVAQEPWVDGAALVYSATDGQMHPVVVEPAMGAIVSVTGVSPIGVSPGVAPVVSLSGVVDVAHGGTASSTGDASLLTNIPAAQLAGDVPLANVAAALAAGGGPVKGTVLTATTRVDSPSIGGSSVTQHALPSGTAELLSADSSAVVTNKTISGSSNTLSNIGNSSLTNSSLTVSAGTGLAGGGAVALGSSTSLSMPAVGTAGIYAYPASVTTDDQGRVSAVTAGSAPPSLPLSRANGGLGSDVSALSTGLLAQTASNTWAVRSVAQGTGITVTNGDGVAGNPTVALTNSSLTINTSGGVTGGGAVALGGSLSLSLSAVPNSALANSSLTVTAGSGLSGGGAVALGASVSLSVDSSAVALLSGAQTFTGQKTFPSAGASAVVIPALRQASGGNDITVPAASGADSIALLAQSQTLTNKVISGSNNTLSNIGNSSLTNSSVTVSAGTGLSGGGSVALGGSTSLSMPAVGTAGTYAYPTSVTTDDRGRVSAISAGSAPVIGGSAVMLAQVSSNGGAGWIFNGDYFGLSQMTESGRSTPTNVAPWVAPCAGTLKNFRTWTVAAAPSISKFTVYQAATSSTPTYNATSAVIAIASGAHLGADTTHTLTIAAGDLIIFKTDTSWTNPGFCIQAQFIPSTS